ncbi:hypothetical protein FHR83_007001 [Actinoplanes campanulatus]|uniref:Uncharacterized protein n=1 Tax=Actinoplanes campanulatus TaxID=113559 RepID=A0A7W5FIB6_9ACTN|nr:hypothetical protein [Actinoplanes campanulatus]MBB3099295.1 hypothetical protein [Actinoplanes campanulatus]GGN40593.1 hypothetical protein GCM10010109_69910 [Actinoplanes campanulatus]GID40612.1 hypothetical protein Aca09nite_71180 [Actinoplanes campanulatus]
MGSGVTGEPSEASAPPAPARQDREEPSIMRLLLSGVLTPEEIDRLEVAPGRWCLPGAPP